MNFHIRDFIQEIKAWFPRNQASIEVQPDELETQSDEQNYTPLSSEEIYIYLNKIQTLSLPESYKNAIQTKILESLKQWKENRNSANSFFILCHPIESIHSIVKATLKRVNDQDLRLISLSGETRSNDYLSLKSQLQSLVEDCENSAAIQDKNHPQYLMIIPDLSLCFLRCVEGLDAVEYLFNLILKDKSRFWFVGCNQWAWNYFDYVYEVNSCFEQILLLPT